MFLIKTHQIYLSKKFLNKLFKVILIFVCIIFIMNLFEEINFFKDTNDGLYYALLLNVLNAPTILINIFPFIFLISAQFLLINLIEKNELILLKNFGIDATRVFMISDSPPDRELEWTDEGIQSSKNLTRRIERYFAQNKTQIYEHTIKNIEVYLANIENNINSFSLNKCIADIYTLFNYLEKNNIFLHRDPLSEKILIGLFPIIPSLSNKIYNSLFHGNINEVKWPEINHKLLVEDEINLPIQINGKLVSVFKTTKDYIEDEIISQISNIDKIKNKLENKKIKKIINVQGKIINIIIN